MHADCSDKCIVVLLGQGGQVSGFIVIGGTRCTPHGKKLRGGIMMFRGCWVVGGSGSDGVLKGGDASREGLDLACQWARILMDTARGSRASVAAIGSTRVTRDLRSNFQVLWGCSRIVVRHDHIARYECRETAFVGLVELWGTGT
jgi:hypothetical protein